MGTIIRNGITYGGGSSTSKEADVWVIISDSYGTVYPEASTTKTFYDYMRELSGRNAGNLVSLPYSGCGFINNAGGKTFLEGFTEFTNTYDLKDKVSKIVVAAGRNDYPYEIDAIYEAELEFHNYCKANYSNAEIMFAFIANGDNTSAGTRQQLINVYEAYKKCTDFGATYMSGSEAILHNSDCMASDGIHPTIYGKQQIAKYLLEGITTGVCHVYYPMVRTTITCRNDNMTLVNHQCWQWVEDNVCYISFDAVNQITFTNAYGMSPQNIYSQIVGTYNGTRYLTNPLKQVCIKENCKGYNESNELNEKLDISYFFESDGMLYIRLYASNGTQSTKYIVSFGNNTIAIPCVYC